MKQVEKRVIKNVLRSKVNRNSYLDDDELFDYCEKRNLDYYAIKEELVVRGYELA